jgi:hypothetical protein
VIKLRAHARAKSCAICLLSIMISAVFIGAPAFSSLTQNVVIQSTGIIVGSSEVNATSGSPADIQAAVNAVDYAGGGTVYIPAGTFYWTGETVTIPGGVNIVGASPAGCMDHENNWQSYSATTILHNDAVPTSSYNVPTMFYVDGKNGKPTRISGIQFEATGPATASAEWEAQTNSAIHLLQCKNYRIDHCTFINFISTTILASAYSPTAGASAYGLVDHCVIDLPYKLVAEPTGTGWQAGYGCDVLGNMRSNLNNWVDDVSLFAGKYEAIPDVSLMIVEDCHFSRCRHAIDGANGGVSVPRFCLFDEPASYLNAPNNIGEVCSHGGGWDTMTAVELLEAYNNTIIGKLGIGDQGIRIRGGHAIVYNNDYSAPRNEGWASRMVILDSDSPDYEITQTYIWDNTYINCTYLANPAGRTLDIHYFLRAPTLAQDGWTYTPYPYPHPLITG